MTKPESTTASSYLTRREAAALARFSPGTIDRLLREPDGPPSLKIGRRVLIPHAEFVAWLEAHAQGDAR